MPFDETKIAPELRRGPIKKQGTSSEPLESRKDSEDKKNLEPVDISVEESNSEDSFSVLAPPCLSNPAENKKHLEKGKEKENCTENAFTTGGQPVPVSTSPVNSEDNTPSASTTGVSRAPISTTRVNTTLIGEQELLTTTPIVHSDIAGGLPLPIINSPADIYRHFPRDLTTN